MSKATATARTVLGVAVIVLCSSAGRAQDPSVPFLLGHRNAPSHSNTAPARQFTVTIPALSELRVQMLSGIHSRISRVGDPVKARVLQAVLVNGRVALPPGTLLDGRVTRVRRAGHVRRPAELAFRFEQITLPDGQAEPVFATLAGLDKANLSNARLDPEGYLRGARVSSKGIVGGIIGLGAIPSVGFVGSAALKTFVPAGGAALLGYEILWPHGNDVHVLPDTPCRLRLNYPLTVRTTG